MILKLPLNCLNMKITYFNNRFIVKIKRKTVLKFVYGRLFGHIKFICFLVFDL